eukprot:CAMPEP_0205824146 /NCGR_PEP_ID=MMETSP0206-20130828/19613_1 /ASSEMBLY_ACC=CAM_ASM_000279 /TAXON_ID=36767 /ORGANISM="Euplotes focardii, Strain TN1" /LENGTH=58 /DNA_ID=CAMNT_0053121981 /DNA_START=223 /DNA_END=396 /DNA_ORIENTATION=-
MIKEDEQHQLKEDVNVKDMEIGKLKEEKESRTRMHLDEIEKLKLKHQQELYMLKKRAK